MTIQTEQAARAAGFQAATRLVDYALAPRLPEDTRYLVYLLLVDETVKMASVRDVATDLVVELAVEKAAGSLLASAAIHHLARTLRRWQA